jgi:hypothetical protein
MCAKLGVRKGEGRREKGGGRWDGNKMCKQNKYMPIASYKNGKQ